MFGVPDVADGAVVLDDSTQRLNDKCNQCSRMNVLFSLNAQVDSVLRLLQPCRGLIQG